MNSLPQHRCDLTSQKPHERRNTDKVFNATLTLHVWEHKEQRTHSNNHCFLLPFFTPHCRVSIPIFNISQHKLQIETGSFGVRRKPRMFCRNKYFMKFETWKRQYLCAVCVSLCVCVCVCVWLYSSMGHYDNLRLRQGYYFLLKCRFRHWKSGMRCNMKASSFITFSIWIGMHMFNHDGRLNVTTQ